MLRRFLLTLIPLSIVGVFVYTVLLSPAAESSRAAQDLTVVNKTVGCEIRAELINEQVNIALKNIHHQTITAWSIRFNDSHRITSDDAFSEVHTGILPGEVLKNSYPFPGSFTGPVTLYLDAVLFQDGSEEGNARVAHEIKEKRLGQKVQLLRALKILQKHEKLPNDLNELKREIVTALDRDESQTLIELNDPNVASSPSSRSLTHQKNNKLSEHLRTGLHYGRATILRRLEELEQFPIDVQEVAFARLKKNTIFVLAKL